MDPRQEILRAVFGIVRDELQGGSRALGGVSGPHAKRQQALLRMLQSDQPPVQWVAMKELGQIGDLAAAEAMMPFTTHPNRDLSDTARMAVRQIQERELRSPVAAPPPPPSVRSQSANSPLRPVPPPPPASGAVVEAHMGRDRGQRLTKGQDLPVPPTEMELRRGASGASAPQSELQEMDEQARPPASFAETGTVGLPAPAAIAEPMLSVPNMAAMQLEQPEIPAMASMADADRDHPFPGM